MQLQSNLCKTATLKLSPLLTCGCCSEVVHIIKIENGSFKWWNCRQKVAIQRWPLAQIWMYIKNHIIISHFIWIIPKSLCHYLVKIIFTLVCTINDLTFTTIRVVRSLRCYQMRLKIKDAGFIYESFQIKTNRVIWDFWPYESNPRYKSFEKKSTNRICNTSLKS